MAKQKTKIAIINCERNHQQKISKLLYPIANEITFLQSVQNNLVKQKLPNCIILFPTNNESPFIDQMHFLRDHDLLEKTTIIAVENENNPLNIRSYMQLGCDYVIPNYQLHQLPTIVDVFSNLSQYRMLQDPFSCEQVSHHFHQPIFICDEKLTIFFANKRASDVLQNNQQSMRGLFLKDYLLPNQAKEMQRRLSENISRTTSIQHPQVSLKTFSNEYVPCSLSIHFMGPYKDADNSFLFLFEENSEIESIKLKSFLLQSVLDKSSSSILITNAQGTIFYANPSLLDRVHLDSSNVLSRSSEELSEEYHLHKRADAFPYITLGFTYFHEQDYFDSNGDYIHEREKILPILYNSAKKEGFLIRITEYTKQNQKQNGKHDQWFQKLLEKASEEIHALYNAPSTGTATRSKKNNYLQSLPRILRNLKIVQDFYSTSIASSISFDCVLLNTLIQDIAHMFPDFSSAINFQFQENISQVFIQKEKFQFVLTTLLETVFERFNAPNIYLSTSMHQRDILLVLRVLMKDSVIENPSNFLISLFEDELWIVKQLLSTLSVTYEIHSEMNGGFAFFFTIPSIIDNMGYKEQEISELL
jgi:PAS domain-containing protein